MKKILVSIMALLSVATVTMAQDEQQSENRPPRMDRTEMIKHHTEMMVKKYGLSDEQATQLQALNEKSMPQMRGPRPEGRGPAMNDSVRMQRPPRPEMGGSTQCKGDCSNCEKHKGGKGGHKGGHRGGPDMTEYNNELQKIMTAEQFKAYQEDMEKMKSERPQRHERKNDKE